MVAQVRYQEYAVWREGLDHTFRLVQRVQTLDCSAMSCRFLFTSTGWNCPPGSPNVTVDAEWNPLFHGHGKYRYFSNLLHSTTRIDFPGHREIIWVRPQPVIKGEPVLRVHIEIQHRSVWWHMMHGTRAPNAELQINSYNTRARFTGSSLDLILLSTGSS